jgi:hypothetical protein
VFGDGTSDLLMKEKEMVLAVAVLAREGEEEEINHGSYI